MPQGNGAKPIPETPGASGIRATFARLRRRLRGRRFGRLADLVAGLMMLGLTGIGYLYAGRVVGLEPITVWPFALWAGVHIVLGLTLSPLLRMRRTVLVVGYGLAVGLLLSEEPLYLLRPVWHDPSPQVRAAFGEGALLRAVSLNCHGNPHAIDDALALTPDIVLLQESPGEAALDQALPPGWSHAGKGDCAVLVRGSLTTSTHPKWLAHEMRAVLAVPARTGRPVTAISTHVVQPMLRTDIWRPQVWRRAERLRGDREKVIHDLLAQRDRYGDDPPVLIGGDFNTRSGDPLFIPFETAGLTDAFAAAGTGWPNTFSSDFPIERIDLVWVDGGFKPLRAFVATTPHSDHRMVVADLSVR